MKFEQAKELRVGNLLHFPYSNEYVEILGINAHENNGSTFDLPKIYNSISFKKDSSLYCEPILLLEPILLTEEWLLKFGFELIQRVNGKVLSYRYKFLEISFNTDNKIISVHIGIQRIDDGKKIKYVHQLQNLNFALIGEELTIKTKE